MKYSMTVVRDQFDAEDMTKLVAKITETIEVDSIVEPDLASRVIKSGGFEALVKEADDGDSRAV